MKHILKKLPLVILAAGLGMALGAAPASAQTTFSNFSSITLPGSGTNGPGSLYSSNILVSGLTGTISKATVTLHNLTHTFPDDLDFLVVSPTGRKLALMSDTGGSNDISGVTLTFSDTATAALPDSTQIVSGTYKPTNMGSTDSYGAPAPAGPYASALSTFNTTNPNGTWKLFAVDDTAGDLGSLGGWSLTLTTQELNTEPEPEPDPEPDAAAAPEPASLALFAPGLAVLGLLRRRRSKPQA